jgi:hypothetical protein
LVVQTADPGCHSKPQFVIYTVDWVIKGGSPGLVVTGDWGRVKMNFMSSFGSLSSVTQHQSNWTRNIPSHAIYTTLKALGSGYMKSWGNTTHSYLSKHPTGLDWKVVGSCSGRTSLLIRDMVNCDVDKDGYKGVCGGTDCDDRNAAINPGGNELCSTSFDDNCDGKVNDPSSADAKTWYRDADRDKYGNPSVSTTTATAWTKTTTAMAPAPRPRALATRAARAPASAPT